MRALKINEDYLRESLEMLLHIPSPAGYTDAIVHACARELERLGVPVEITRRGAIRARMQGGARRPARAIVSHLDTLGAQVKALKPNGRLEVVPIGHWSARFAEGARCIVFSEPGSFHGTILPLKASGHTFGGDVDTQPVGWQHVELRVDVPAESAAELEEAGIAIGDFVAIDPHPEFMDNGFIVSRHLDNKAGVAVMLAAIEALISHNAVLPVDVFWLFTIAEEVGVGASSILTEDIASMVTIDNGTTAPGQSSREFGVTIAMADQTGPFDYHLTQNLIGLCKDNAIPFQRDIFRFYRSDSASALEAGNDVRTALATFGVDASHGFERIHMDALLSLAALVSAHVTSKIEIARDARPIAGPSGFPTQPTEPAPGGDLIGE
jgi:peptidase M42 family hydrolase